jgi:hypothetical protein
VLQLPRRLGLQLCLQRAKPLVRPAKRFPSTIAYASMAMCVLPWPRGSSRVGYPGCNAICTRAGAPCHLSSTPNLRESPDLLSLRKICTQTIPLGHCWLMSRREIGFRCARATGGVQRSTQRDSLLKLTTCFSADGDGRHLNELRP